MSARRRERAEEEKKEAFSEEEEKEEDEEEEDLEEALREAASASSFAVSRPKPGLPGPQAPQGGPQVLLRIPEAVDDFLRNFLQRAGMRRTLCSFEAEWYGGSPPAHTLLTKALTTAGSRTDGFFFIPDALTHRQLLLGELEAVRADTERLRRQVLEAGDSLVRMRRETDFHRLQYRRVTEDKHGLTEDIKRLKEHLGSYEPALRQLDDKYQAALTQRTLVSLAKEPVRNTSDTRVDQETSHIKARQERNTGGAETSPAKCTEHPKDTPFPAYPPRLARVPSESQSPRAGPLRLTGLIRAHQLPVSDLALHPGKPLLASASDDRSWRLWALPVGGPRVGRCHPAVREVGQMMLTGEGHSDWLSGCSFHPDGAKLATTGGDTTVRLWDFSRGCCVLVLSGHSGPTWGCSFHSCGHFLASCSSDRTAKLWDLPSQRCRLRLHRHTASVNSVSFLPLSNLLLTCSADKTLALWDARLGVCTATFQGHRHPCNHAAVSPADLITASCDSSGVVCMWDIRKPASAISTFDAGPMAANQVAFSPSGKRLAVAGGDGVVRVVEVDSCEVSCLSGHKDSVQSVTFDHKGETLMSAGSDGLIHIWS